MISSVANPRIRRVRRLRKRAHREARGRILIEGHRAIVPALDAKAVDEVLYTPAAASSAVVERARAAGISATEVSREVMAHLTAAASAPGVLAIARTPAAPSLVTPGLILDGIRDPATLGSLIALTAATGGAGVAVLPGCTDAFDPKVLRAAGAAHFRIRVAVDPGPIASTVERARADGATVLRLAGDGPAAWDLALPGRLALLVSDDPAAGPADGEVAVPASGTVAPLTLRAAGVLYEWVRQMGRTP